jgi:hypothetical protein
VCAFPRRRTLALLRAILDQVHAVVRKNRAIFGADRILAKDSVVEGVLQAPSEINAIGSRRKAMFQELSL